MFDYPVTLTPDDGTVLVTFADVPEAITFGADEDEALLNAIDALETGLSFYVEARKPLPVASRPAAGQKTVQPSALECAKLGVYQAMTDQGIKKAELARRLRWHMPQIDRKSAPNLAVIVGRTTHAGGNVAHQGEKGFHRGFLRS
ncbi:type II toxin-antitoxin system HicB family antitoxin [Acidiferrobacter sp.]